MYSWYVEVFKPGGEFSKNLGTPLTVENPAPYAHKQGKGRRAIHYQIKNGQKGEVAKNLMRKKPVEKIIKGIMKILKQMLYRKCSRLPNTNEQKGMLIN